ncbi:FadR/GntR family transcriptional regulator [Conexibacter arvalis]|uniref:DNA-binding FadR family transcriptional regulator n=1 Tax=Conexibacter arvalis TaxID=912552 RepID=A0A840IFW1_9ACTN|nr:GntR family transcriptional regulator [Conexibacter arvalis]MBB4663083.1 DNA-binding FadR family transcriptional regulator [Conexibacter arvalis]
MSGDISRDTVPDQVFERLREAIVTGDYEAGARLPTQRALAADLGVNMATVREALGRLEQLRLVETRHGSGTHVLDWRRSGGLDALTLAAAGAADPQLGAALFEARRLLLREAARLAAARRADEQAEALAELAEAVAAAPDDTTALLADWAFMAAMVEAAGNLVFQLIMNSVRELYLPHAAAFAALVSDRERLLPHYRAVATAIRDRDRQAAAAAIELLASAQERRMAQAFAAAGSVAGGATETGAAAAGGAGGVSAGAARAGGAARATRAGGVAGAGGAGAGGAG